MTPEQQDNFLSALRDWADQARDLSTLAKSLVDQYEKFGSPTNFDDRSGNLALITIAEYAALLQTMETYLSAWDASIGEIVVQVAR